MYSPSHQGWQEGTALPMGMEPKSLEGSPIALIAKYLTMMTRIPASARGCILVPISISKLKSTTSKCQVLWYCELLYVGVERALESGT